MTELAQVIGGLVLCLLVALVYTLARKNRPASVLRGTAAVFVYILGAISAVTLVVLLACKFK